MNCLGLWKTICRRELVSTIVENVCDILCTQLKSNALSNLKTTAPKTNEHLGSMSPLSFKKYVRICPHEHFLQWGSNLIKRSSVLKLTL